MEKFFKLSIKKQYFTVYCLPIPWSDKIIILDINTDNLFDMITSLSILLQITLMYNHFILVKLLIRYASLQNMLLTLSLQKKWLERGSVLSLDGRSKIL